MIGIERNSSKTFRLRFNSLRNSGHSGSHRHCNGVQLKCCLYDARRTQRLLLLPEATGPMVPAGNRAALNNKKFGLPQTSPVYLSDNGLHFPFVDCGDVSRVQQKGWRSTSVVDDRRFIVPTLRTGEVYIGLIYRKVSGKTSRQIKKFCLRLFTESNCSGFLFHTHLVSTRFWNRHDNFCGYFHNAFYRRAQEKISISFDSSNCSLHSLGHFNCRIPDPENHRLPRSMGRSLWNWIPGHPVFLRFWKGRLLGYGFGRKLSETFSSSRSAYGFYFFCDRRRVGIYRNYRNRSLILNFHMERVYDGLPSQRSFRNSFSNRVDSSNWFAGFYKPWSCFRSAPYKGADPAFYKYGRLVHAGDDAFSRGDIKYFRASCKTLMMN